jgi:hypothetical protein
MTSFNLSNAFFFFFYPLNKGDRDIFQVKTSLMWGWCLLFVMQLHFIWSMKYVFGLAWSLRCSRTNLVDEWMRLQISTQNIIIIYGCVFMDIHVHFKDALRFVLVFNKLKLSWDGRWPWLWFSSFTTIIIMFVLLSHH